MLAVTIRGLAARKLRTFLTALAVVLGVAMIAGTFIFTDTINKSFDNVFSTALKGVDVSITPKEVFSNTDAGELPAAVLAKVRSVPGVENAVGSVFDQARIVDKKGKLINGHGAPSFISSADPAPFSPFNYVQGHAPRSAGELALDKHAASKAGYKLGDVVRVRGQAPERGYRLVGIAKFGNAGSLAGASVAILILPEAQRATGNLGHFDAINVKGASGVDRQALSKRIRAAVGPSATVRTGQQEAAHSSSQIKDQLSFLTTLLLVFGGIALFVGAFMIFNSFSITVAQRIREFAILRMLGGSRRQVLWAVAGEALIVGLLASIVGLAAGFAIAPGLKALLSALGAGLPSTALVFKTRTIVTGLLVGTLVTLVASVAPAIRATRIAPIAALQDASTLAAGPTLRRRRVVTAGAVITLGVVLMVVGLFAHTSGGAAAGLIGAGAAVVFLGVALISSVLVKPLASAVGRPLERMRGIPGRLARENAQRNPRRTASTAAALMVGVTLVAFITVFAAGLKHSINRAVDRSVTGQVVVQEPNSDQGVPLAAVGDVSRLPEVSTAAGISLTKGRVSGSSKTTNMAGVSPDLSRVYHVNWKAGRPTFADLGNDGAALTKGYASDHHLTVGSQISVLTPTGAHVPLTVRGIFKDDGQFLGHVNVSRAVATRSFGVKNDQVVIADAASGVSPERAKAAVARLLDTSFQGAKAYTKPEFKKQQASQVNQILALFYALLSLAVIVSLFGIVNTLVLTVYERTRELGMLRAIGASRRQIKRIVRYEAIITALIGAVIGVVLGVIFSILVTRPLASQGFVISIPLVQLILLLVVAAICGTLAAIAPARRAAKLDVLQALAYE
jgi:putative ABC transport system permease protein